MNKDILIKKYRTKISSTKGRIDKLGNKIEMKLTLDQWIKLWEDANVIPSREYVLSRINDVGHYEIGNVYVQHNLQNVTESMTSNNDEEQRITNLAIQFGYKRRIIKSLIKKGLM
jgi:hypothetical protein